jgi:hypothetical protein
MNALVSEAAGSEEGKSGLIPGYAGFKADVTTVSRRRLRSATCAVPRAQASPASPVLSPPGALVCVQLPDSEERLIMIKLFFHEDPFTPLLSVTPPARPAACGAHCSLRVPCGALRAGST